MKNDQIMTRICCNFYVKQLIFLTETILLSFKNKGNIFKVEYPSNI